jgi:glutamate dehydrogenase (NAD(P)+)
MAWIMDQYGKYHGHSPAVVTGKPLELYGSAGREAATGRGLTFAIRELLADHDRKIEGSTFVVQGFGNVGSWVARLLHEAGGKVIAVSDVRGGIRSADGAEGGRGLDVPALVRHEAETGSVVDFAGAEGITNDELLRLPCDVLIPAALGGVFTPEVAREVQAAFVVEGANGPTLPEADRIFRDRGIVVVPDIYANAGGVTVSYFEWVQNIQQLAWDEERVNAELERIMVRAHRAIVDLAKEHQVALRTAAFMLAIRRVKDATLLRGI